MQGFNGNTARAIRQLLNQKPQLALYRRHRPECPHRRRGANYIACECPVWVDGRLDGGRYRRSMGTPDWPEAQRRLNAILYGERPSPATGPRLSIGGAVRRYLADCETRNVRPSTVASYRRTLSTLPDIAFPAVTRSVITDWRAGRNVAPSTGRKELEHVRFFFRWCLGEKLIEVDPTAGIKPPRVDPVPTLPYGQDEVNALLAACGKLASDNPKQTPIIQARARAFLLLLLYSGLRRSDAGVLRRSALDDAGYLTLRVEKTRVRLKVKLPAAVADELRALPGNPQYFFWTGRGKPATVIGNLWRTVNRVGKLADVHATPHRFRDTFACRLLEQGADIRTVSKLLGHTSIRTTEKHYAPWMASQQKLLDAATARLDFEAKGAASDRGANGEQEGCE